MFNNPFDPSTKRRFDDLEKEVKDELSQLSSIASDIILDERYKKFSNLIGEAEKNTINLLLNYKENDPYKYKAKVDEFLIELRVYRNMLNSVKDLVNPLEQKPANFVQRFKKDMGELIGKIGI